MLVLARLVVTAGGEGVGAGTMLSTVANLTSKSPTHAGFESIYISDV